MYDVPPDWNPIVGPAPGMDGIYVAVGFSGHGFRSSPTMGEALAQTILGLEPRVPIDMYSMDRFDQVKTLMGAYSIGSMS
jgi:sarcosine oxidase subunit beta